MDADESSQGLLSQTPPAAVGKISIARLDEARAALEHLVAGTDSEALHDFRVAIRRLRSTATAWKKALRGRLTKRDRKALRALQQETGGARDAEVALAWLDALPEPDAACAAGYDALRTRLAAEQGTAGEAAWDGVAQAFDAVDQRLRRALSRVPKNRKSFARALAKRLRRHHADFDQQLRDAVAHGDPAQAHRARVRGKRLRYLVEPVVDAIDGARGVVKACKRRQDNLGDLNDAHVLAAYIERVMPEYGESERAGLAHALASARTRYTSLFDALRSWVDTKGQAFADRIELLARSIELSTGHLEIERKYLLTGLPRVPDSSRTCEIQQGYLPTPSPDTEERVRSIHDDESVHYVRTLKRGAGLARQEVEESIDRARFDALWPDTHGRRVHKRRHVVPSNGLTWEIDEFLDRELVLAEVELSSVDETAALPDWLAPYVAREVTDDIQFANSVLAR